MCEIAEQKRRLRKEFLRLREELKCAERDGRVAKAFAASPFWAYDSFFVYLDMRSEAETRGIIAALTAAGKRVCVPRIEGDAMRAVPWSDKLERGPCGVLQPREGEDTFCRVAVTPLLAADEEGYRLGYGGGYYDRYFAAHPDMFRVGLAYEGQLTGRLPRDTGDVPLDAVVTEEGVRLFGKRNA